MKRIGLAAAALVVVALGVAAAAGAFTGGSRSRPVNVPPPPLHTALRLSRHFACFGLAHRVDRQTLGHFRAVTAVSCSEQTRTYPGQGQWEVAVRRVAVGSVSGLQRYYEQPDDRNLPKNVICDAVLVGLPIPAFFDAHGRWVVPVRWPEDGCGHPLGYASVHGIPTVRWRVVRVRRIRPLVSAPALAAHCAMKMGNTVAWAGPREANHGGPLFDRAPWKARICVYRTPPDHRAVGNFVRGFRLDAAQTRQLLGALKGPSPGGGCPIQRTFALVAAPHGNPAGVELGGCWRVERPDRTSGTAEPAVVRAILGQP
jgi:hypothetical protein